MRRQRRTGESDRLPHPLLPSALPRLLPIPAASRAPDRVGKSTLRTHSPSRKVWTSNCRSSTSTPLPRPRPRYRMTTTTWSRRRSTPRPRSRARPNRHPSASTCPGRRRARAPATPARPPRQRWKRDAPTPPHSRPADTPQSMPPRPRGSPLTRTQYPEMPPCPLLTGRLRSGRGEARHRGDAEADSPARREPGRQRCHPARRGSTSAPP